MASNFHMFQHRTNDTLHLKLMGDFDGSSAFELIHVLKKSRLSYYQVIVNTSALNSIHPFGLEVFQRRLSEIEASGPAVRFIGKDIGRILH